MILSLFTCEYDVCYHLLIFALYGAKYHSILHINLLHIYSHQAQNPTSQNILSFSWVIWVKLQKHWNLHFP